MSPEAIKAKAFDQVVTLVSELPESPTRSELAELLEQIHGLDYVVSETISGQERSHQAYQRTMEEA